MIKITPSRPQKVIIIVWLIVYSWRPWFLGWYHDDWAVFGVASYNSPPFSLQRIEFLSTSYWNRPVLLIIHWFSTSLLGTNTFLWQQAIGLIALIIALRSDVLFALLLSINPKTSVSAAVASIGWLILPWQVSVTAWPIVGFSLIALWLFIEGGIALIKWFRFSNYFTAIPPLLFLLSGLTYEVMICQPLILFMYLTITEKRKKKKTTFLMGFAILVGQILILTWSQCAKLIIPFSLSRPITGIWFNIFCQNLISLIPQMLLSISQNKAFMVLTILIMSFTVYNNWRASISMRNKIYIFTFSFILIQIFISVLTYSLAGYSIAFHGIMARTSIGLTLWLCFFISWITQHNRTFPSCWNILLIMIFALSFSKSFEQINNWHIIWRKEQEIIQNAPIQTFVTLSPGTLVIYDGTYEYNDIPIFGAYWDITGAMATAYPELRSHETSYFSKIQFTVKRNGHFEWDGQRLQQYENKLSKEPMWTLNATTIWVWQPHTLFPVTDPREIR